MTGKPLVLKGKERLKLKNPTKMCVHEALMRVTKKKRGCVCQWGAVGRGML